MRTQLVALACPAYEVGIIPSKHRPDLPKERIRRWTAEQVLAPQTLGWLRRMNALDRDIFIRPAPRPDGLVEPLVFVDDLNAAQVARMEANGFEFAARIESSPGNFHGWVRLADRPLQPTEATEAAKTLARTFGADPHSADWRHFGRLAGFTNRKQKHRQADGLQPFAELRSWTHSIATAGQRLLDHVRQVFAQRAAEARQEAEQKAKRQRLAKEFGGSEARLDDAAGAFLKARARFTQVKPEDGTPDHSARDFSAAMSLLRQGFSADQVGAAIRTAAPNLAGHALPDDYIARTVQKADTFVRAAETPTRTRLPGPR